MTNQEIFERVYRHLVKQKVPALAADEWCAYRGVNGTMCAVGCLIKDEFYRPEFEGTSIRDRADVIQAVAESLGTCLAYNAIKMLVRLQEVHDLNNKENSFAADLQRFVNYQGDEFMINLDFLK